MRLGLLADGGRGGGDGGAEHGGGHDRDDADDGAGALEG